MKTCKSPFLLFLILSLLLSLFTFGSCDTQGTSAEEAESEEEALEIDMSRYAYVETPYAGTTLTVYNWGEYISDGSEGTPDVIDLFEEKYNIHVIYSTYASNEDMYAKLKSGGISYDVICPSEYMVGKLIEEDMLATIDTASLSNYEYVDEAYKNLDFDPNNEYFVPYTVGKLGIIYNTTLVDPEDVEAQSWDLMWNEKYKGMILTFDNARDAFGIAQFKLGLDVNDLDLSSWDLAQQALFEQREVLQGYVMDEIFQAMEGGNAAIAAYYAGDCISMIEENEDLAFYYPVEGTNLFFDGFCIPKNCKNYGAALLYINFMMDEEIATFNANYIAYASPMTTVLDNPYYDYGEGTEEYEILYGTPKSYEEHPETLQIYSTMPNSVITYYNALFDEVKAGTEGNTIYIVIFPVFLVVVVGTVIALSIYEKKRTKKI